jgi:hypothetical protein
MAWRCALLAHDTVAQEHGSCATTLSVLPAGERRIGRCEWR